MKKLYVILFILIISTNSLYAFTWDTCAKKYKKAKQFSDNTKLSYIYLKGTKNCLVKFRNFLKQNPNPEFTVEAMSKNILMLEKYIHNLLPPYIFPKNTLEPIAKYVNINTHKQLVNKEYEYIKKFKSCNGVHAHSKIYTAKHCKIEESKNLQFDLNYIKSKKISNLKVSKLKLDKTGTFKYYSMSKEGMFYNILLQEKNCKFYKAKNTPTGLNITLDLSDLNKEYEIRSTCLAIPSNSGGGVFQEGKLVGIISKTILEENRFLYSIVEPIFPISSSSISSSINN